MNSLREFESAMYFANAAVELDIYLQSGKANFDPNHLPRLGQLLHEVAHPQADGKGGVRYGDSFLFPYVQDAVEKTTGRKFTKTGELALELMVIGEELKNLPSKVQELSKEKIAKLRDLCLDFSTAMMSYYQVWNGSGRRMLVNV